MTLVRWEWGWNMAVAQLVVGILPLGFGLTHAWALARPPRSRAGRWFFGIREGQRRRRRETWGLAGLIIAQGVNMVLGGVAELRRVESTAGDLLGLGVLGSGLLVLLAAYWLDWRRPIGGA